MHKNSIQSLSVDTITIIGDNIIKDNNQLTAYYIVPLANYNVTSKQGTLYNIQLIHDIITRFLKVRPNFNFSLISLNKIIKKEDVLNNLLETIKIYRPEYTLPEDFISRINNYSENYCLFAVPVIDTRQDELEEKGLIQITREVVSNTIDTLIGKSTDNDDIERILYLEQEIFNLIQDTCARASKDLTFYNYASKLYPSYNISYDKTSYINEETFNSTIAILDQTLEDNFGYFKMYNDGLDFFGQSPSESYGCVLKIKEFPNSINPAFFPFNFNGANIQVHISIIPQKEMELKFKRKRSGEDNDLGEAAKASANIEDLEEKAESIDLLTMAVKDIKAGEVFCFFDVSILLTASTLDNLKKEVKKFIGVCNDRKIVVIKSLNQSVDFIQEHIRMRPKQYTHVASLYFPLSFQLNNGSYVGEVDGNYFMPSLGDSDAQFN